MMAIFKVNGFYAAFLCSNQTFWQANSSDNENGLNVFVLLTFQIIA